MKKIVILLSVMLFIVACEKGNEEMKEADIRLLCYIFVGFSPQVISLFMKDTVANVYARKSRLKSRIKSAETANKELFLALFG